jgi:hypothetical protein
MRLQSSLLIFGQGALCEEVHSPSLNRSGNGEGNRPRGCNNYAGGRCCRRRHRSGDGAIVSLAGAQDVDALQGKRGVPLQLHRSLDRLNASDPVAMACSSAAWKRWSASTSCTCSPRSGAAIAGPDARLPRCAGCNSCLRIAFSVCSHAGSAVHFVGSATPILLSFPPHRKKRLRHNAQCDPVPQLRCRAGATFSIALSLTNSLALSLAKLFGSVRPLRPVLRV